MAKVFVGLSGGVDSSVAAALLQEQGHQVTGVYMKNWTADVAGVACAWKTDLADAQAVAANLDIPFRVYDFQSDYRQAVVDVMVAEYAAGRTPNPDVLCNQEIKFKLFLATATADGAKAIATGHYAHTANGKLLLATDSAKDQTYFLYRVSREALEQTMFPLQALTKPEVRELALRYGLPTATKPDSQGICFVGEVGLKPFLREFLAFSNGPVVELASMKVVGQHDGAIFVTIGQRHGLGIGGGEPYYVCSKDIEANTIYVSRDARSAELQAVGFALSGVTWIGEEPAEGAVDVRIRHRGEIMPAQLVRVDSVWQVRLDAPALAVAPGQSAVVIRGREVLGGGFIGQIHATNHVGS